MGRSKEISSTFGMLSCLSRLSSGLSRSISAENPYGQKGSGGMATDGESAEASRRLGRGWKVSPCIRIAPQSTFRLAEIDGPGAIQHIWMTVDPKHWRELILRFYWENEETPSVEVPLGDFFCNGWGVRCTVNSLAVAVNPAGGFNCYWEMPFQKHARITIENLTREIIYGFFYQIDYCLAEVGSERAYFHAQWRRSRPVPNKQPHKLLDGVRGQGHYVGTYMAIAVQDTAWWGEGEVKFFLDGDEDWPTICGTGTEDYFGGAWGFETSQGKCEAFTTPFLGLPQVIETDPLNPGRRRFGLYRWHVLDPIRFQRDLRITIQDLGYQVGPEGTGEYVPRQDDIATTAFWYQTEPHSEFTSLPDLPSLEVG